MDGITKVAVLKNSSVGRGVMWSGETFHLPGGITPLAEVKRLWREKLVAKGRVTDEQQDEAVRAILDLASTHVGFQGADGQLVRPTIGVVYVSDRTGEEVTITRDPVTQEAVVVGETPEEKEEKPSEDVLTQDEIDAALSDPGEPNPFDPVADGREAREKADELRSQDEAREEAKPRAVEAEKLARAETVAATTAIAAEKTEDARLEREEDARDEEAWMKKEDARVVAEDAARQKEAADREARAKARVAPPARPNRPRR